MTPWSAASQAELRDHQAVRRDLLLQPGVIAVGVYPVDTRADDGDGASAGRERGGVRGGVDA